MLGESSWESHAGRVMGESSGSGRVMRWRCMGDARELENPGILVSRSNISFYSLGITLGVIGTSLGTLRNWEVP